MTAALSEESDPQWAPLIDMAEVPLATLLADTDSGSKVARCVQRLVNSLDDKNGVISAFSSFIN
jgi:hypothetical protein